MSLEDQVVRVMRGAKDTLKTLMNKMGVDATDELIDEYPTLAESIEALSDKYMEKSTYDSSNKEVDIFTYVDEHAANIPITDEEPEDSDVWIDTSEDEVEGMPVSVYDPQGKKTDIFKYVDTRIFCVTPQMFGAVGDGITDDTAAVQAAIDSGMEVVRLTPEQKNFFDRWAMLTPEQKELFFLLLDNMK